MCGRRLGPQGHLDIWAESDPVGALQVNSGGAKEWRRLGDRRVYVSAEESSRGRGSVGCDFEVDGERRSG